MGSDIDARADQYALGCTAFQLLTGAAPYQNSNAAVVISQHLSAPPPLIGERRPELAELNDVITNVLAKDPGDRYSELCGFRDGSHRATGRRRGAHGCRRRGRGPHGTCYRAAAVRAGETAPPRTASGGGDICCRHAASARGGRSGGRRSDASPRALGGPRPTATNQPGSDANPAPSQPGNGAAAPLPTIQLTRYITDPQVF